MQSKDIVLQVSEETAEVMVEIMEESDARFKKVVEAISESADARSESEATLLQAVKGLAQNLVELQKLQSGVMDKLNSDDSQEKLISTLNKLSDIEKEILQTKDGVGNVADTLRNCNTLIEQLLSSVKGLQENDEKILNVGGENTKKADELGKQTEETSKLLFEKMGDILTCLDTLSHSVQAISEKQNELFEKQAELDKDVKYLKLPFFKRWFTKG